MPLRPSSPSLVNKRTYLPLKEKSTATLICASEMSWRNNVFVPCSPAFKISGRSNPPKKHFSTLNAQDLSSMTCDVVCKISTLASPLTTNVNNPQANVKTIPQIVFILNSIFMVHKSIRCQTPSFLQTKLHKSRQLMRFHVPNCSHMGPSRTMDHRSFLHI